LNDRHFAWDSASLIVADRHQVSAGRLVERGSRRVPEGRNGEITGLVVHSIEVSSMRLRCGAVAPMMVALSALLPVGCGVSNEENLGGETSKVAPQQPGMEGLKGYGDAMKYQAEQAAKNRAAKGKAGARSQPAPPAKPSQPEAEKEKSKTP
jgi:hypothetical protein